ncbi:hypothetical protein SAMN05444672_106154 [Bacillus sp. OK838]|nr:hypothetical protein SAMN05444672_106154 [Bacillus sp. OK838]
MNEVKRPLDSGFFQFVRKSTVTVEKSAVTVEKSAPAETTGSYLKKGCFHILCCYLPGSELWLISPPDARFPWSGR